MSFRSLLSNSALTLLGTALGAVLSIAYISQGARILGPTGYGTVGAAVSLANLFFLALNPLEAGLTLAVARLAGSGDLNALQRFCTRTLRGLTLLALALFVVFAASVAVAGDAMHLGEPAALYWLGGFCAAALLACEPRAALRGRESFGALASNLVFEGVVRTGIGLPLLWAGGGPPAMVAGYALGMLLALLHGELLAQRGLPPRPAQTRSFAALFDDARLSLGTVSAPLIGLNLYTVAVGNIDTLTAAHYLDAREAGLYAGAASLARMVPIATNPLLLVMFSRLAAAHAAAERTAPTVRLGGLAIVAALGLSMVVPLWGGEILLGLMLGEEFRVAHPLLVYQWATSCLLTLQIFAAEAMLATSRIRTGWIYALPAGALLLAMLFWHDTALEIARASFVVCALLGSLACAMAWRARP